MMSGDSASLWEPRYRNGRILVSSAVSKDDDSDADAAHDVVSEAGPRHSQYDDDDDDNEDEDDDLLIVGTESVG